ncbi:hypothetical protein AVEN_39882-1 [Araneus ventricosus]|uniref:Uncharacterized protein n=1 Tax=Araneus ventricosus TaxID=182803 RepID=A0A4Y2V536_ARAVE|nr:hypothetical protein AVEN_39882-1 [Araneus ventricosus]
MEMNIAKTVAVCVMLHWMWALFQVLVFGNFSYVIYLIPYALTFKNIEKSSTRKKAKGTNVGMQDFSFVAKKDVSISTEEIDSANNKTSHDKIELNINSHQNGILASNPFLDVVENLEPHGDPFDPLNFETMRHPYRLGNPLMGIMETATAASNGEPRPPLLHTNPFLQDCMNNPFFESSLQFTSVFVEGSPNLPFSPRESDAYCKEWVKQHRKCHLKTVRSFSCY